jgi:hypothetical protein
MAIAYTALPLALVGIVPAWIVVVAVLANAAATVALAWAFDWYSDFGVVAAPPLLKRAGDTVHTAGSVSVACLVVAVLVAAVVAVVVVAIVLLTLRAVAEGD